MALWLKTLPDLPEVVSLIPSDHMVAQSHLFLDIILLFLKKAFLAKRIEKMLKK